MWKCNCGHENPNSARWCENCYAKGADQESYVQAQGREYAIKHQQALEEERKKKQQQEYKEAQERKRQELENTDAFLKANGHQGFYEYKVISLSDNNTGSVNTYELSDILNNLGRQGWRLRSAYTNELGVNQSFGTNSTMDQNVLILERFIKFT